MLVIQCTLHEKQGFFKYNMKKSPYDGANFFSKLLFLYASSFLKSPSEKQPTPEVLNSDSLSSTIIKYWTIEINSSSPKIFKCIVRSIWKEFALINIPLLLELICMIILSYSVGKLALFYYSSDPISIGFGYSILIVSALTLMRIFRHYAYFRSDLLGIRLKYALMKISYQKLSRISHEVVNSSDVSVTMSNISRYFLDYFDFFTSVSYLFVAPIAWVSIGIILYFVVGYAGVIGICVMLFTLPVQFKCNNISIKLYQRTQKLTESKLKLITETFDGIRIIKSNQWETIFLKKIIKKRDRETQYNRKLIAVKAFCISLRLFSQLISSIVIFSIVIQSGNSLRIDEIFFTINLIYLSDAYIATMLPVSIDNFINYYAGSKSFQRFLLEKEKVDIHKKTKKGEIQLRDIVSYWTDSELGNPNTFFLNHVNLEIKQGELCVLYGPTGSGKTALLLSIIGEIFIQHGSIYRGGSVAYVQQDPWIYSGSIRENILIGKEFDDELYSNAINYSMLSDDLNKFPKADMTIVGNKGSSLSGGQRARIGLARAIYSNADIYIFDNTLGGFDMNTTKEVIDGLIVGYLRGKTRILATYLTDFVQEWMKVIKIEKGSLKIIKGMEVVEKVPNRKKISLNPLAVFKYKTSKFQTIKQKTGLKVFLMYWKHVGSFYLVVLLLLYFGSGGLQILLVYFLTEWSTSKENSQKYLEIIILCASLLFVVVLVRNMLLSMRLVSSASKIHNTVIRKMLFTSTDFFETNQKDKVLKRFNNDFGVIDQQLPQLYCEILQLGFMLFSNCVTIIISNPYILIIFVFVIAALFFNMKNKLHSIVSLYQNNSSGKAQLQGQITSVSQGIFEIRSYKLVSKFQQMFNESNQNSFTQFFSYFSAIKYLNITNELILILLVLSHTFLSVLIKDSLNFALLSTSLSFIVNILFTSAYLFALVIRLISNMSAVSYMSQCTKYPKEDKSYGSDFSASKGAILFQEVDLIYENGNVGLSKISFELKGGQRHGIVGKSGSGKSSLISVLLRFYDISGGNILIDGVNLFDISLESLRKTISIASQSPVIFEDSIRFNVDPEGMYEDNEIWLVLRLVEMDVKVMTLIGSLDAIITTGSLSIGEKQLICLARCMIKRCRIMILDEVMSNVDYSEEIRLYDAIDSMSAGSTILIITHRLDSLVSCSSIILVEMGKCVEAGNPKMLLSDKKSKFYQLAKASEGGISSMRQNGLMNIMSKKKTLLQK